MSNLPLDIIVDCESVPGVTLPTVDDDCDAAASVSSNDNIVLGGCPQSYTIERTFTASDACGNTSIYLQTITVQDTTRPILANVPIDVTVNCESFTGLTDPVVTTDNCDPNVNIVYTENTINNGCADSFTIERQWLASDACGNSALAIQSVVVQDTVAPIMSGAPADITIICGQVPPAAPTVIATDNCDPAVIVNFAENSTLGTVTCTDSYTITRTWEAIDRCGNTAIAEQIITVEGDDEAPVIANVPLDMTVECSSLPEMNDPATATDNCSAVVDLQFNVSNIPGDCPDRYTIVREWIATDDCGNTSIATQEIEVQDNIAPVLISIPSDVTIQCGQLPPAAPTVIGADNCDPNVSIVLSENSTAASVDCTVSYEITRTWVGTDRCGNSTSAEQIITVEGDDEAPVLANIPASITVECSSLPVLGNPATATDNCDSNVDIVLTTNTINGACADTYIIERTWTATDDCGNSSVEVQTIDVQDNTAPVMSGAPADITIICGQVPPSAPTVIATDNCDPSVSVN